MTVHRRRGRYFEELEVGDIFVHRPGRTVAESDNILFSALSMNSQSLHFDAEFAASSEFGQRLVNSMFTVAVVIGLGASDITEGTGVANLGFDSVRFPNPVFVGDTITAETEVLAKRASNSRRGQGIVSFEHRGRNQRDEAVCVARRAALLLCRETA